MKPSQKRLKAILDYNPATGVFLWKIRHGRIEAGSLAGSPKFKGGRIRIRVDGGRYNASDLAVVWMTGKWPFGITDHRDNNPQNDRWENLRSATEIQNRRNRRVRRDSTTGLKGVSVHARSGKFYAHINCNGKQRFLGSFFTPREAHAAYAAAAIKFYGDFARF